VTTVVNIKNGSYFDVFIGRGTVMGYGNPYKVGPDGTREQVIEKYKVYFYKRLETNPEFKTAVLKLKGKVLGCYCKPLLCHGDIIVEYLDSGQG